jgi:nucleotide-binding universal stress UspA family protein
METNKQKSRILVGVDGSPPSQYALLWAAAEARRRGSDLDVLHAWTSPIELYPSNLYRDPASSHDFADAILETAAKSVANRDGPPVEIHPLLVEGAAAVSLVEAAVDVELLVVGSRGRGGFTGLLLGSVSRECVHRAPCPVAVVRGPWAGDEHGRIVVGVDGSEPSYAALRWAIAEAGVRGSRLYVVNAYVSPLADSTWTPDEEEEVLEKASRVLLDEMVSPALAAADARPLSVETIATGDRPASGLLAVAHGADLLVVGSRGRGGFRGLLLGSVSEQCLHHATCPVVVVQDAGHPRRG